MMSNDEDRNKNAKRQQVLEHLERLRKEKYDDAIDEILKRIDGDTKHNLKRIISFEILDSFLDCCKDGVCPHFDKEFHNFLIDISVHGYYQERAYYYGKDQIGHDNDDRYFLAVNKVDTVFRCQQVPEFDDDLFEQDLKELESGETANGARHRKAFWRFMERDHSGKPGDPVSDFCGCEDFIDRFVCGSVPVAATVDECKRMWKQSLDVVNGVDLYRFCRIRKQLSNPDHESDA
jgi:hypothetical protein